MEHKTVTQDTWFIAHNESLTVTHSGFCAAGTSLSSGQPIVEEFDNEADWEARRAELGIIPEEEV